jgi:preprotein translocase subunit YajC
MRRLPPLASWLLPLLVLALEVASVAPLLTLAATGLDADEQSRDPFIPGMFLAAVLAYWLARRAANVDSTRYGMVLGWAVIAAAAPWLTGIGPLWDAPVLGVAILASAEIFLAVWRGIFYAGRPDAFSPDELSGIVQRSWLILAGSVLAIAVLSGIDRDPALRAASVALPLAAISALMLLAMGQMQRAAKRSREVGGTPPDRRRWLTFTLIFAVAIAAIAMGMSAAIGDDTSRTLLTPLRLLFEGVTFVLSYVFYGIALVFFVIFYPLLWLVQRVQREQKPQQQQSDGFGQQIDKLKEGSGQGGFPHWLQLSAEIVAVVVIVAVVLWLIARTLKKSSTTEEEIEVEEEHESLFSRDLLMSQLKGLFRRDAGIDPSEPVDLRRTPGSVREAYRALLALAARDGVPRRRDETPAEFALRLRRLWPSLASEIGGLTREYELARYADLTGEAANDRARNYWSAIWAARQISS